MAHNVGGEVHVWSLPEGKTIRTIDVGAPAWWLPGPGGLLVQGHEGDLGDGRPEKLRLRSWRLPDGEGQELGRVDFTRVDPDWAAWIPSGTGWLYAKGKTLFVRPLPTSPGAQGRVFSRFEDDVMLGSYESNPDRVWALDRSGLARIWASTRDGLELVHEIRRPATASGVVIPDPGGQWLATDPRDKGRVDLWRAGGLSEVQPISLRRTGSWYLAGLDFHPSGEWLAVATPTRGVVTFWPLRAKHPVVVDGYRATRRPVAISPDSRWVATTWEDMGLRLSPLPGNAATAPRLLELPERSLWSRLVFDPQGRFVFAVGIRGMAYVVPLDGSPARRLQGYSQDEMLEAAAVSPSGRLVASAHSYAGSDETLRVWDLISGETQVLPLPVSETTEALEKAGYAVSVIDLFFADEQTLYTAGNGGLRRWNLSDGSQELVFPMDRSTLVAELSDDRRWGLVRPMGLGARGDCVALTFFDLEGSTAREMPEFGDCVRQGALDSVSRLLATGDPRGFVRVGNVFAESPHILAGHEGPVEAVAISPDQCWVASTGEDNTLRIWPMPDLSKPPLHALPHEELITKLKSLTNVRAVRDPESSTGWSIDLDPFPGWKEVPG